MYDRSDVKLNSGWCLCGRVCFEKKKYEHKMDYKKMLVRYPCPNFRINDCKIGIDGPLEKWCFN